MARPPLGNTVRKVQQYRIRLSNDDFENWKGAARALQIPLSVLIREAVNDYLIQYINQSEEIERREL